jgi:hypothetical protein
MWLRGEMARLGMIGPLCAGGTGLKARGISGE